MTYKGNVSRDGFWINWETGRVFLIDEHQRWMRQESNAARLGVPPAVISQFRAFPYDNGSEDARTRFLTFLYHHAPVMRVRGHGESITFEFAAPATAMPQVLRTVQAFCRKYGVGDLMRLHLVNFQENKSFDLSPPELLATLRTATKPKPF